MRIVSPHSSEPKSCGACESGETFQRIFIREFCDDFFARAKAEFMIGDVNSLIDLTDEMHFNSACAGIVDCMVPPMTQIKVRSEGAVGVHQQIQIELRCDAFTVVVGPLKNAPIVL